MTAAESLPNEAMGSSGESGSKAGTVPTAQVGHDETSSDEKDDVGSEMEEKRESPGDAQVHSNHVDREVFPTTFDDLCRQMTERANFLLEVRRLLETYVQHPFWQRTLIRSSLCLLIVRELVTLGPDAVDLHTSCSASLFPAVGTLDNSVSWRDGRRHFDSHAPLSRGAVGSPNASSRAVAVATASMAFRGPRQGAMERGS